jgi:uncharacterized protein (DUF885 family)
MMPVASGMLTGCALSLRTAQPSPADSVVARNRLARAHTAYWQSALPYRPDLAMALGLRVEALPPHGEASARNAARFSMQIGTLLDDIDAEALTPREYVVLQSLQWETETQAAAYAFADLDLSLLSPRNSALRMIVDVIRRHPLEDAADVERYLTLLDDAAPWISGIRGALEQRQARGTIAPVDAVLAFAKYLRALRIHGGSLLTTRARRAPRSSGPTARGVARGAVHGRAWIRSHRGQTATRRQHCRDRGCGSIRGERSTTATCCAETRDSR